MSNDDRWQKREDELFTQEREKLKAIEQERAFLKDRSIGGVNAPRPTDDFIDRSLGQPLNDQEIIRQAGEKAERQVAQEQAAEQAKEREALKQPEREKDAGRSEADQAQAPKRKLSDIMREGMERAKGRTRTR